MLHNSERIEQFTAEIAEMKLPDTATSRDRMLLRLGAALMVVGVAFTLVAYAIGHGTRNPLQQRDAIVSALIGVSLTVAGAALFIRYSMAQFLRFWLARLSWEHQAQTDRLVEALQADGPTDTGTP
jgi:hypothetical protein